MTPQFLVLLFWRAKCVLKELTAPIHQQHLTNITALGSSQDLGLETFPSEEQSFIALPLCTTHFTAGKVSPGPRSHTFQISQ